MKIRSFYSPVGDIETVSEKSETIPDQSLSVKDIMLRYTRGTLNLPPVQTGDDDDIDVDTDFDDMIDAHQSFRNGVSLTEDMMRSMSAKPEVKQEPTE